MSGNKDYEQPQRYCGNCGAEVRSGNAFCVSCGAPVSPGSEKPGSANPGPAPSEGLGSFTDDLRARLRRATDRLGGTFSSFRAEHLRHLRERASRWFRNLPGILKLVLVGAVVLVLAVLLSPLAVLICALVLGVSIIALIIAVAQKRSIRVWGIITVTSLVLMVAFGGISDALYGIGLLGSSDPKYNGPTGESEDTPIAGRAEPSSVPTGSASSSVSAASSGDVRPASGNLPYYEVVYSSPSRYSGGINLEILVDATPYRYRQDIEMVFEDIEAQTQGQYDYVYIIVRNYGGMNVGGGSFAPGQVMLASGHISHTDTGEAVTSVPSGSYSIQYYM